MTKPNLPSWLQERPFAHRGQHDNNHEIPENSLLSFKKAIQKGYAIELDVHLLKDREIAVFHDDDLKRMCNHSQKIEELDLEALKIYTLGNSKEKIPSLDEVLSLVNGQVPILIEIKSLGKVGTLEPVLVSKLKSYKGPYAVQSFNPFVIAWFVKNAPSVLRGQLSGNFKDIKMSLLLKKALQYFLFNWKSKPHFIAYDSSDMPSKHVAKLRQKKILVLCWTVRSLSEYERVKPFCDNIIFENFEPLLRPGQH